MTNPSTNELELRKKVCKIMYHVEKSLDPEAGTELVMTLIDKATREAILTGSDSELEKLRAEINMELEKRSQDYMKESERLNDN